MQFDASVPLFCRRRSDIPLESEEAHHNSCTAGAKCPRCYFWKAYHGLLRRGGEPSDASRRNLTTAWKSRFTYKNAAGETRCWLSVRPLAWGGPWGIGCFVCNKAAGETGKTTKWARIDGSTLECSALQKHAATHEHITACRPCSVGRMHAGGVDRRPRRGAEAVAFCSILGPGLRRVCAETAESLCAGAYT